MQEIDVAGHVQKLLFPKSSPVCDWSCVGVKNRMAEGLGGDYFDFLSLPDGCQALFIGDVTGHGLSAAVVMTLVYGYIHRSAESICAPTEVVAWVNRFLLSFADRSEEFDHYFSSTLFLGFIQPESLMMAYVNAGHPAPLIRRGDRLYSLPTTAPPVGFFADPEIGMGTFQFEKQDRILLYTDGITESAGKLGGMYGFDRLEHLLKTTDSDHMEFLDRLFQDLKDFTGEAPPEDDCTAIVIDFHNRLPGLS